MEESTGAQYALQIALQTLRERCQQFQQRVVNLEEENLSLRNKLDNFVDENTDSLTEIIKLKQQVTQLTDQKNQLSNNFQMVSIENRRLWARLSNVTQINDNNLESKLNKVNSNVLQSSEDNVSQNNHSALTRSKTFTQDEPRMKIHKNNIIDENEKLSLELQEISLKLLNTIAQEKLEVETQFCQINEIENSNTMFINSFAFPNTSDTIETTVFEEFDEQLTKLKSIKGALLLEKTKLQNNYSNLTNLQSKYILSGIYLLLKIIFGRVRMNCFMELGLIFKAV